MDSYAVLKIFNKLDKIMSGQKKIAEQLYVLKVEINNMSVQMDALLLEVKNTKDVQDSVLVLVDRMAARLRTLINQLAQQKVDTTALQTMATELATQREKIAAAVVANTDVATSGEAPVSGSSSESASESASPSPVA
jgi:uncharacterized protein Yka (UPF0111/DUF47 family)